MDRIIINQEKRCLSTVLSRWLQLDRLQMIDRLEKTEQRKRKIICSRHTCSYRRRTPRRKQPLAPHHDSAAYLPTRSIVGLPTRSRCPLGPHRIPPPTRTLPLAPPSEIRRPRAQGHRIRLVWGERNKESRQLLER